MTRGTDATHLAAWDIGGAHLKLAVLTARGETVTVAQWPTPIWQGLHHLEQALARACRTLRTYSLQHVVTMTAELADCFESRRHGVQQLVTLLETQFAPAPLYFYSLGGLLSTAAVRADPLCAASANWHATLQYTATRLDGGMLLDIGSTTTDLLPFHNGEGLAQGGSDAERMQHGELLYSGVVRTPVYATATALPWRGTWQPVIPERFADMADVYRLLGRLQTHQDVLHTADGAGREHTDSARRLARMAGLDLADTAATTLQEWQAVAGYLEERQLQQLHAAAARLLSRHPELYGTALVAAGAGAFLSDRLAARLGMVCIHVTELLHPPLALRGQAGTSASALALAHIACQQLGSGAAVGAAVQQQ